MLHFKLHAPGPVSRAFDLSFGPFPPCHPTYMFFQLLAALWEREFLASPWGFSGQGLVFSMPLLSFDSWSGKPLAWVPLPGLIPEVWLLHGPGVLNVVDFSNLFFPFNYVMFFFFIPLFPSSLFQTPFSRAWSQCALKLCFCPSHICLHVVSILCGEKF